MPTKNPLLAVALAGFAWLFACCTDDTRPYAAVRSEGQQTGAPSNAQLQAFSRAITRFAGSDYEPPSDPKGIVSRVQVVVIGEVVDAVAGRKEFLGYGCNDVAPEDESGPCNGDPSALLYASYANLVIHPQSVAKGELTAGSNLSIEFAWPNNLPLDAFVAAAPKKAHVVVAGDFVADASAKAAPLEASGIAGGVAQNLVGVPPYGFIVEDADGKAILPIAGNQELATVLRSKDERVQSFNEVMEVLDSAARSQ